MDKLIGIIGGMGPLATCDLFQKIIENTDARTDHSSSSHAAASYAQGDCCLSEDPQI